MHLGKVRPRLDPIPPLRVRAQDVAQACMWVAAAARIVEAAGMGPEAEDLRRVLDRVAALRSAKRGD